MDTTELLKLVKLHCIFGSSLTRAVLIRHIQISEGNFDCYAALGSDECGQQECSWREDCRLDAGCCIQEAASRAGLTSGFQPSAFPLPH
ncbi:MAG: hypothetical protein M0Q22_08690 [Sulfuritalea sp.]|jgi:hypothetical protein|nr:hypothetical protein [Sulfuritalea sp.]